MADLFPTFEMPAEAAGAQTALVGTPEYLESWAFDFESGEFILDANGRVTKDDGHAAWVRWCVKAVLTARFAHLIYSTDYGCEADAVIGSDLPRAAQEAEIKRTITEAVLADPRSQAVTDFTFGWQGDQVSVGFTLVPVVGTSERVEVKIG